MLNEAKELSRNRQTSLVLSADCGRQRAVAAWHTSLCKQRLLGAGELSSGVLVLDGVFKSTTAGVGAVGVAVLGREVYVELVPNRPNRTYYRVIIARVGGEA